VFNPLHKIFYQLRHKNGNRKIPKVNTIRITDTKVIKCPEGSVGFGIIAEIDKFITESKTGSNTGKLNTANNSPLFPVPIAKADRNEKSEAKPKQPSTNVSENNDLLSTGSPSITDIMNHETKPNINNFNQTEKILAK